jgi:hypothetical protein
VTIPVGSGADAKRPFLVATEDALRMPNPLLARVETGMKII